MTPLRGLAWDHPRGYAPLRAAAARPGAELEVAWDVQPLDGFESAPIAELASRYDLLVLDHPHVGDAVAAGCLVPIDDLLGADEAGRIAGAAIGASGASYALDGRLWALPIDAAAQVMALAPARLGDRPVPTTWPDVLALAEDAPVVLSLAGPHALLTFWSICCALGDPPDVDGDAIVAHGAGLAALGLMRELVAHGAGRLADLDPIGLLERMAREGDIACCPLVFGYAAYAHPGPGRTALRFADAPGLGSTLGGTGLAVTARCPQRPAVLAHLRYLVSDDAQRGLIPHHGGQPALRRAWRDGAVDVGAGGFYGSTVRTLEAAWVRPRASGAIGFQARGSALVRAAALGRTDPEEALHGLRAAWADIRPLARNGG